MSQGTPTPAGEVLQAPNGRASVAFWIGILNTGGLMLLGAYCLKGAVDHQTAATVGASVAAAIPFLWR